MKVIIAVALFHFVLVMAGDLEEFVKSNKEFTANIYKELAKENNGNFLGCPMSAEIVLSMVHAGAKKRTAEQLAKGLSLPDSVTKIKSMMDVIIPELKGESKVSTLITVNKMYVSDDFKINQNYETTVTDVFKSTIESVDFKKADQAVSKINNWVSETTNEYIKDLIQINDVDETTKAILLSAIYFQATWAKQFYIENTKKSKFYTSKAGEVEVDTMDTTGSFKFHKCDDLKAKFLKMPYVGKDLSMVVILPDEKDGLGHIEANIHQALDSQKYDWKKVHVNFPKFKMDATIKFIPILEKLGIVDLFKPDADLSGMTSNAVPLYVTKVIQKNYIEVNEKGTMAASATAGVGSSYNPELPIEFIADRPFIYFIESPAVIAVINVALVLASDRKEFVQKNKKFTANIYKDFAKESKGNFLISPLSMQLTLGMMHAGANNQTAEELAKTLIFPNSPTEIDSMIGSIRHELQTESLFYTLTMTNGLYVSDNCKIENDYKLRAIYEFNSNIELINFRKPDEAVTKINNWISKKTNTYIKRLVENNDINENTKAILLNAISFQLNWVKKFDEKNTKRSKFRTIDFDDVEVDMMDIIHPFEVYKSDYFKATFLKMPFVGKYLSMVVILPDEKNLEHVETNIEEALNNQNYTWKNVHVNFPKFKMESTIKLIPILERLGVVSLFTPDADLNKIVSNFAPFYISNVIQKICMEVNENGTISVSEHDYTYSRVPPFDPKPPFEFIANHPFIYYIKSPVGIVFVGRYSGY
ncbi:hypothetical protein FQR65_LT07306 [Abscondita terminalis]|nr:hypothetical protein FQR65_LT07306 [Abscondita terminalis]